MMTTYDHKVAVNLCQELRAGKLVIFPTETVYGLACDASNDDAVRTLYALKKRKHTQPLTLMTGAITNVRTIASCNELAEKLMKVFLPGPLTVILPAARSHGLSSLCTKDCKVGIRIPNHPIALDILQHYGKPLAVTSVNHSGEPAISTALEAEQLFGNDVAMIIKDSTIPTSKTPSTVIDLTCDPWKILREGALTMSTIRQVAEALAPEAHLLP